MGNFLYAAGANMNALTGAETFVPSSENSLFPLVSVGNGDPGITGRFGTPAANDNLIVDLNQMKNGNADDWAVATNPDNWEDVSQGTGLIQEETVTVNTGGGSAIEFDSGGASNFAIARYDVPVLSGNAYGITGAIRGSGSNPIDVKIQLLETGEWLNSGGSFQAGATDWDTRTTGSYATKTGTFTVPGFSTTFRHQCTLRIEIHYEASAGTAFADDFGVWPHWDFVSFHDHNFSRNVEVEVHSDDNVAMSSPTLRIDETTTGLNQFLVERVSFWGRPAAIVTERYVRFRAEGTPASPLEWGEIVCAQIRSLARVQNWGWRVGHSMPNQRAQSLLGIGQQTNLTDTESRSYGLEFTGLTEAARDEVRDEIFVRGGHGRDPVVMVLDDTKGAVVHARTPAVWEYEHDPVDLFGYGLAVTEDAFAGRS